MAQSYIFGGNTGLSYDQIQKQRDIANELLRANMSTPQNVGEGLSAIGRALAAKAIDKRTTRADAANRAAYGAQRDQIFGTLNSSFGGATTPASYSPPPTAGEAVANDTMSVLGNFGALEDQYKLPQGYLDRTYAIESGGNPNAKNPNSSAEGPFQFIDSTAAQYGLTDKTDLGASAAAAARLAADNKAMLTQALGREPTAGELYLAHQQGGAGAVKLLSNPNARAVDIVGPDAVTLNGGDPNMTASEFAGKWVQKFGGGAPQGQPAGQPPINPAILMQLAEIQGNPYASESDKAIANVLMGQVTQAMDPMRQMEMEKARLELDQMKNPKPGYTTLTDDQEKTMGLDTAGLYQVDGEGKIYTIQEPAKPASDPNSVREYNFYSQQETAAGRPVKSYDEWKTANAKAGASSVTVGGAEPNDAALRKKLMEGEGTAWADFLKAGSTASGMQQDMALLDQVIELAPSGPVTGRLAEMFPGVSDAAGVFQSVVKRVAPSLRVEGSGSQSDVEYNGFLQSLPALQNRPEANRAISAFLKAKAQVNMDRAAAVSAYQNGEATAAETRAKMAEIDKRSIMTPEMQGFVGNLDGGNAGAGGPAPDGVDQDVWDVMTEEERALFQ